MTLAARFVVHDGEGMARLLYHIGNMPHPFIATIKAGEESRRDAQNRLSHRWYADVARQLDGWTVDEARAYSKLRFGVAMLRREEEAFREQWDRLIRDRFTVQEKLDLMLPPTDYPVTRLMTVRQMNAYMDAIHRHWSEHGVRLTDPEALKYEGMI